MLKLKTKAEEFKLNEYGIMS